MSELSFPIEMMDARELVAHPQNFRRHPLTQRREINKSLSEFGWLQNVIWNERTGYILDGHARIEEAAKRGESVPVRVVDVSPAQEKRIILAIGKTAEGREIDEEVLAKLLTEVVEETGDLPPGWSSEELDELLKATAGDDEETLEEDEEETEPVLSDAIPAGIPLASIRMVQLYLTQENIDRWQEWVAALAQHFEQTTTTDTVVMTVKACYDMFCSEEDDENDLLAEPVAG